MANWRTTKTPGVYVAHVRRCPAFDNDDGRCRCEPSWRGRRHNRLTGKAEWQKPVTKDRSEVLSWLGIGKRGAGHARQQAKASRTFESIGDEWLDGVEAGRISRRKGRSKPYSATTVSDYASAYRNFLRPEFGPFPADDIGELEWQMWCDRLSREGLSRSRISTLVAVAVASAIYARAMTPTRRYASRNPLRLVELPPNDEKPRLRVAFAPEAERLLDTPEPEDALPYAIAAAELGQRSADAVTRRQVVLVLQRAQPPARAWYGDAASPVKFDVAALEQQAAQLCPRTLDPGLHA